MSNAHHRPLIRQEIEQLEAQGCQSNQWDAVQVDPAFEPSRVHFTHFSGSIRLGTFKGSVKFPAGLNKPAGLYHAFLHDCTVGHDVRIANIGAHIASYDIGDRACIEDIGVMEAKPGARFGNGVEVEVLNEGGGREVILFNSLDAQFAYLLCLHRYRTRFIKKLLAFATAEAETAWADRGCIGEGAHISGVVRVEDVNVGRYARVLGAARLVNGTILSEKDAPTTVGAAVDAEDFIIAESSVVDGGVILGKTFVGQGCRLGKQFSAEGSLFFANCEGFHGEACSLFAGPYTVTHHKSSLLIAGLFSFFNAGSGTNQSNHMYKLGPIHEGKVERGSKAGSSSYLRWPCRVGPFSVILGKHTRPFDTSDFPFSHLEAGEDGRSMIIPGFNLTTVGTVRDGDKWPRRDRRKGTVLRDRISSDVLSPFTVGRMLRGTEKLAVLQRDTPKTVKTLTINGIEIKRLFLRTGQKFYRPGIQMYLLEQVIARIEQGLEQDQSLHEALASTPDAVFSEKWLDIGGQLMPAARLESLVKSVEEGKIASVAAFSASLDDLLAGYPEDEWVWVKWAVQKVFDVNLDQTDSATLATLADNLKDTRSRFLNLILNDAAKEFDPVTRAGFGHDGNEEDVTTDFEAVRGIPETNAFVLQMKEEIDALESRIAHLQDHLVSYST